MRRRKREDWRKIEMVGKKGRESGKAEEAKRTKWRLRENGRERSR